MSVHPWYVLYLIILHQMWCATKKIKWEERREEKAKERKKTKAKKGGGEACKSITFSNSS